MALYSIKHHTCFMLRQSVAVGGSTRQLLNNKPSLTPLFSLLGARTLTRKSLGLSTDTNIMKKLLLVLRTCKKTYVQPLSIKIFAGTYFRSLNDQLTILSQQFARQCYGIVTQRIRRGGQTVRWYSDLGYDKTYVIEILKMFSKSIGGQQKRFFGVFAAVAFNWKDEQITEHEVYEVESEITHVNRSESNKTAQLEKHFEKDWEKVIDRPKLLAWRKPVPGSSFYQYKLYGTVDDLPARAFYNAQIDIDYRKQWDKLIIKLDVVDRDRESNSEVLHWVSHFPYPMYPREYVYIRKFKVDHKNNLLYTMAKNCSHPAVPVSDQYVRVDTYISHMVIRPYTSFDEAGFDYILTYYDEPKSNFPTFAYNWIASSGVPDFVEQMYTAARYLHKHGKTYHEQDNQKSHGQMAL